MRDCAATTPHAVCITINLTIYIILCALDILYIDSLIKSIGSYQVSISVDRILAFKSQFQKILIGKLSHNPKLNVIRVIDINMTQNFSS